LIIVRSLKTTAETYAQDNASDLQNCCASLKHESISQKTMDEDVDQRSRIKCRVTVRVVS